jgi:acyl-coenzyme A thioesterase 9
MDTYKRPTDFSITRTLPLSTDSSLRRRFLLVDDEDVKANFRFGLLLEALDKLAEETCLAYVQSLAVNARVVTAAIDGILVRAPITIEEDILLLARINHVFSSSLEVGIRIEQVSGFSSKHVASCYFTMAARLREQKLELLPLRCLDDWEHRRSSGAVERRNAYLNARSVAESQPSGEEYQLLGRLHAAQDEPDFDGNLAANLTTGGWEETYPEHEYVPKKIFGGYVIHRAFVYATICAELIASGRPIVASVDRVNFHRPVRIGDKLHFVSRVVYTGRSSIVVEVDITRHSRDRSTTALCNTCIFTFVNADASLRPCSVPAVYPTNYIEDARYLNAYRRHLAYKSTLAGLPG